MGYSGSSNAGYVPFVSIVGNTPNAVLPATRNFAPGVVPPVWQYQSLSASWENPTRLDVESETMQNRVALWNAINRYAISCGGDPAKHVYGNTTREEAVVEVEKAVDELACVEAEEAARRKIEHDELVGLHGGHHVRKGAEVKS